MSRHLSEQELMEAVEGSAGPGPRAHLEQCALCRGRVEPAREALALASGAEVPEPAAPYWEAFRRRVGRRIEGGGHRRPALGWPILLASAAVLLAAVGLLPSRTAGPAHETTLPAWTALPPSAEDEGLAVLQALAGAPEDLAPAAGCQGEVPECLASLSEDETRALAEDLRHDLARGAL